MSPGEGGVTPGCPGIEAPLFRMAFRVLRPGREAPASPSPAGPAETLKEPGDWWTTSAATDHERTHLNVDEPPTRTDHGVGRPLFARLPASGPARQEILQYPIQLIAQGADVFPLPGPTGLDLFAGPGLGILDVALASDAGVDMLETIGRHGPREASCQLRN